MPHHETTHLEDRGYYIEAHLSELYDCADYGESRWAALINGSYSEVELEFQHRHCTRLSHDLSHRGC